LNDYIKKCIGNGVYIELLLNEFYVPQRDAYQNYNYNHQNLIYGYKDDEFYILGVLNGKPVLSTINENNIISAHDNCMSNYDNEAEIIYCIDPVRDNFKFSIETFKESLSEYLSGEVSKIQMYNLSFKNLLFGINIYNGLMQSDGIMRIKNDVLILYLLYEHKKCMNERLLFLRNRGYLKEDEFNTIQVQVHEVLKKSQILLNCILKSMINRVEISDDKIIDILRDMKSIEAKAYNELLSLL